MTKAYQLALVLLMAPALAMAQPAPPKCPPRSEAKAEKLAVKAARFYKKKKFKKALGLFEQVYELCPLPNQLYNIGKSHQKLGHLEQAIDYLKRFLVTKPANAERVEFAIARMKKKLLQTRGLLKVDSKPPGAAVKVGQGKGSMKGKTPLEVFVKPGKIKLSLTAVGYLVEQREVEVVKGKEISLAVELRSSRAGFLALTCAQKGARVILAGKDSFETPIKGPIERKVGRLGVMVEKEGFRIWREVVRIEPGKTTSVEVKLEPIAQAAPVIKEVVVVKETSPTGFPYDVPVLSWALWGTSLVALGSGVAFGVMVKGNQANVEERRGLTREEAKEEESSEDTNALLANVSFGLVAATALAGTAVYLLAPDQPARQAEVRAAPVPGGGIVSLSVGF